MKIYAILGVFIAMPMVLNAQNSNGDVDTEIDSLYQSANVNNQAAPALPGRPAARNGNGQPIYIVNQATPTSTAQLQAAPQQRIQQQPTTIIEATPLSQSRAEQIRKARQDAELATEQKIVEKLETSRMEDERRRADNLFGDRLNSNPPPAPVVVAPQPQTVVITQPLTHEIRAAAESEKTISDSSLATSYISGVAGLGEYPGVDNVRGNYMFGFNVGSNFEGLVVEGGFTYGNYSVDQLNYYSYLPTRVDVNQFSGHFAAKFEFIPGRIRPWAGGLASINYRTYRWDNYSNSYNTSPYSYSQDQSASSTALDMGVTAGVDVSLSQRMSVGLDFRYLFNVTSRRNNDKSIYYNQDNFAYGKPLEDLQYYIVGLGLKYHF